MASATAPVNWLVGSEMEDYEDIPPAAQASQKLAELEARYAEGDSLPEPPDGYPAVASVEGATVLGYLLQSQELNDCYGPDGAIRRPGDAGYLDAQYGRLGFAPMPSGWRFEKRITTVLVAIVEGNPIFLEESAKRAGYPRALADGPNRLNLGEVAI